MNYLGLDVSSTAIESVAFNEQGQLILHDTVPTSMENVLEMINKVKPPLAVVFEEGELADWLYRSLVHQVDQVVVADPWHNHLVYGTDQKDDLIDAEKLAMLLRGGFIKEVYHTADERRADFKNLVLAYHDGVNQVTRAKNKLKAQYRRQGIMVKDKRVYDPEYRQEYLRQVRNREVVILYHESVDKAVQQYGILKKMLTRQSRQFPQIRRFKRVPGVGPVTAATFFAIIDDPYRFSTKQQVWSYSHLGRAVHASGGTVQNRKQKRGNRLLKRVAMEAALAARKRRDNQFRRKYIDMVTIKKRDPRLARRIVARQILTTLWVMWKKEEEYKEPAA